MLKASIFTRPIRETDTNETFKRAVVMVQQVSGITLPLSDPGPTFLCRAKERGSSQLARESHPARRRRARVAEKRRRASRSSTSASTSHSVSRSAASRLSSSAARISSSDRWKDHACFFSTSSGRSAPPSPAHGEEMLRHKNSTHSFAKA